jgi:glycosyltransferase involved in cell wall biosynthesis
MHRILFLSHGHPELNKGGAEVASWNLFEAFKAEGHECLYVARNDAAPHGGSTFSIRSEEEVLFHTGMTDWFCLSSSNTKHLFDDFGALIQSFKPTVIHIHHYAHIGIEVIASARQAAPDAKIIFTLHEFMAMCLHNGQMVKTETLKLCYKATHADCSRCFPQHSPGDFFLRKSYIQDQFSYVDEFVSPSQFLADRYIEWGIDKEKMHVIENVLPAIKALPPRKLAKGEKRRRFAFFGQINPYKGIDILLDAFAKLPEDIKEIVTLDIHGASLEDQTGELKEKVAEKIEELGALVTMRGPYESHQLPALMGECDWIIIPSIWWENSPVVIQEAIAYGRPLIGSNIGGMKEKIEGIAGITFDARSSASLSSTITKAIEIKVFNEVQSKLKPNDNLVNTHMSLLNS